MLSTKRRVSSTIGLFEADPEVLNKFWVILRVNAMNCGNSLDARKQPRWRVSRKMIRSKLISTFMLLFIQNSIQFAENRQMLSTIRRGRMLNEKWLPLS